MVNFHASCKDSSRPTCLRAQFKTAYLTNRNLFDIYWGYMESAPRLVWASLRLLFKLFRLREETEDQTDM